MAEECTESSIATASATHNWWPDLHTNSLSWSTTSNTNPWLQPHHHQNPSSNSSGEEDLSISNQSGLSVDSSRHLVDSSPANHEFIGETASDNQLWSHVLLSSVGSRGELNNTTHQGVGHNSSNIFSSKGLSTGNFFEPAAACSDYLKKMDHNNWEFTNPSPSFHNFDQKHFNGFNQGLIETERLTKLSNLVSNWSIAPPDHSAVGNPTSFGGIGSRNINSGSFSCYGQDHMKVKDEYQIGLGNSFVHEDNNGKYYYGMNEVACSGTGTRSLADVMNFSSFLNKPSSVDVLHGSKPVLRSLNLSDCKKQGVQPSSHPSIPASQTVTRSNLRGQGNSSSTSEGKKKRSEENSETALKKAKHESSTLSSSKMQVPKVKLGDKITALQQIVSPFGKTDTASVLGEAIGYIKFLQEQVQLLSNPYIKANTSKDPWGGLDRKDRGEKMFDLKSRGLCLVPVSCTPQAYRENTGSDYWTPTYRGCLYR